MLIWIRTYVYCCIKIDGDLMARNEHFGGKYSNFPCSFEELAKLDLQRLYRMARLSVINLLVFLVGTHTNMLVIFIVCSTSRKMDSIMNTQYLDEINASPEERGMGVWCKMSVSITKTDNHKSNSYLEVTGNFKDVLQGDLVIRVI